MMEPDLLACKLYRASTLKMLFGAAMGSQLVPITVSWPQAGNSGQTDPTAGAASPKILSKQAVLKAARRTSAEKTVKVHPASSSLKARVDPNLACAY